jgi:hypothetical protein
MNLARADIAGSVVKLGHRRVLYQLHERHCVLVARRIEGHPARVGLEHLKSIARYLVGVQVVCGHVEPGLGNALGPSIVGQQRLQRAT